MRNLTIPVYAPVSFGERGRGAIALQQLLVLDGYGLDLDGVAGPATFAALNRFRSCFGLPTARALGEHDWFYLCRRFYWASGETPVALMGRGRDSSADLGMTAVRDMVAWVAVQMLEQRPRELTANSGPWVRFFARGQDGIPWCAAFVSTVVAVACEILNPLGTRSETPGEFQSCPVAYTVSCPDMAAAAQAAGRYTETARLVRRGDVILFHPSEGRYKHVGICLSAPDLVGLTVETIEGNTSETGGYDGTVVARKTRGLEQKGYILLG